MGALGLGLKITILIVSIPLAAWLGAVLTHEGRPLARVVERHFRFLVVGLVLFKLCVSLLANGQNVRTARIFEFAAIYLLAMLFVPMLRRLRHRTEQSLRTGRAK
jgi:hypothetical protein